MDELKRTALYERHKKDGAKLVPFAGWEMPLQYKAGPIEEHNLTRRSAGLFDISHMGRFEVTGGEAAEFLDALLSSKVASLAEGESRYGLLCRDDGGILDDLFVYRLAESRFLVVVNASNREKDLAWILRHAEKRRVSVKDISEDWAMFALQGPRALELLLAAGKVKTMPERFFSAACVIAGGECLIGRTGYTGEDGVEIFVPREAALPVWDKILAAGTETGGAAGIEVGPVGLAARDSLRFEPGFALYGHELSEKVTPVEAALLWACDLSKPFVGRDAIAARKAAGPKEKLVTFEMVDKSVAREGYAVVDEAGIAAGRVVSGMFAPTVGKFAGNAYVRFDLASVGKTFYIVIRDAKKRACVVKRPLYVPAYRK